MAAVLYINIRYNLSVFDRGHANLLLKKCLSMGGTLSYYKIIFEGEHSTLSLWVVIFNIQQFYQQNCCTILLHSNCWQGIIIQMNNKEKRFIMHCLNYMIISINKRLLTSLQKDRQAYNGKVRSMEALTFWVNLILPSFVEAISGWSIHKTRHGAWFFRCRGWY